MASEANTFCQDAQKSETKKGGGTGVRVEQVCIFWQLAGQDVFLFQEQTQIILGDNGTTRGNMQGWDDRLVARILSHLYLGVLWMPISNVLNVRTHLRIKT